MADWKNQFNELPEDIKDKFSIHVDKCGKDRRRTFNKMIDLIETHHIIRKIDDKHKQYQLALNEMERLIALQASNSDAWKEMVYETSHKLMKEHKIITSYPDEFTPYRIYIWNGKCYEEDLEAVYLRTQIEKVLEHQATEKTEREIINKLKTLTSDKDKRLHRDKNIISMDNCMFNTATFATQPTSSDRFVLNHIPIAYNHKIGYADWEEYVKQWVGEDIFVKALQEYIGYIWVDGQPAKKLLYLDGDYDSGKSIFCIAIQNMLGPKNYDNLTIYEICKTFDNASLYGKLANIRSDIPVDIQPQSVSVIKPLTGGDTIKVQRKYEQPFKLHSRAKIIWTGNGAPYLPESGLNDDAVIRRWLPIAFPYKFLPDDAYNDHISKTLFDDEPSYVKQAVPDDILRKKLFNADMRAQIFNWSVEGIKRLKKNHWVFSYNPNIDDIRGWFNARMPKSDVEQFMIDTMETNMEGHIVKHQIFQRYLEWCKKKRKLITTEKKFFTDIKDNKYFPVMDYQPSVEIDGVKRQLHAFRGVQWKS